MDAVEAFDPDGCFLVELVDLVRIAEQIGFTGVRLLFPDSVRVMRFVVEDEDVLLAADLFEHALDQCSIAFDVSLRFNDDARQVAVFVLFEVEHR